MKSTSSLVKFGLTYMKNYTLETLAMHFPKIVPQPLYVGLSVGTLCNFQCRQCDLWKMEAQPEKYLSSTEIKKILVKLKKWLGPFRLTFTGAEPLIREDFIEIIDFASMNDIYTIVTTNGWLISEDKADKLINSGVDVINISLDGVNPQTHDYLRGKNGAYKQVIKAVGYLVKAKRSDVTPKIYLNTVVMEQNLGQLEKLVNLAEKVNVDAIRFQALESKWLFGNKDYDSKWFKSESLWPNDNQKVKLIFRQLIKMKKKEKPIKNTIIELSDLSNYYCDPKSIIAKYKNCYTGVRNF